MFTTRVRRTLALLLACVLCLAAAAPAVAETVTTGPRGTSYFEAYSSGSWDDLLTPPHYADGLTAYCLNQELDYPVGLGYNPFDPASLYGPGVITGLNAILFRGYPYTWVTDRGAVLTADQARYATANAIRAWLRETTGAGWSYMDLRGYDPNNPATWTRLRPKPGYEQAFIWTLDLLNHARNQSVPVLTVGASPVTLTPTADYSRLEGWTQITGSVRGGYGFTSIPAGVSVENATGALGEWIKLSVPNTADWRGSSFSLGLFGQDDRVPARLVWLAPGSASYQRVVSVANPGNWAVGASGTISVGSGSGAIRIAKTDATDGAPLAGAAFELYWNSTLVATGTTDDVGDLTFSDLAPGTWRVVETDAPTGYVLDVFDVTVTVADGATVPLAVTNERALRPVRVLKTGEESEPLSGAVYEIRGTAGAVVATLTTGDDGTAQSDPLAFGDYELVETVAPLGHVLDATPHPFTITRTTPVVLEIPRTDPRVRGTMRLEKRSEGQDARLLAGAGYALYRVCDTSPLAASFDPTEDPADPVASLTTDAAGVARSEPLEYGCYYAIETTAPVGHAIDTTRHYFEIREDEAIVELTMSDEVLPIGHGGVMLRYRNVWDGTEIAPAWGYNAEIGSEYMPRVRAEGLDKKPIQGYSYVTADYAPYTELVDGKLLVTYWYRRTVSGDWIRVRTGDDGRAELTAKDRETYGLLSAAELYSRLQEAKKANPDVIGYIAIPGTDLHEPVVQTTDNVTYLAEGPDGEADARGAIFADYRAPRYVGDSSRMTLLHGHNMRDGSMFGVLASYGDPDFWAAHPFVQYVDAAGNGGTWLVYSARLTDGSDDAFTFPVTRPYYDRVARFSERSILDPGFAPAPDGRTLTLSTCAYHVADGKLLVHAELVAER